MHVLLSSIALAACADSTLPPKVPVAPAPVVAATPPAVASPAADPAPTTEGDVTVAWMRGMQILVKRVAGAEFTAAQLDIRGGVRNWTKDNAGIEEVALAVATSGGTAQKLASLGASISMGAGDDFGSIATKAPTASWDALFPMFVDTFLAPALPSNEFDIVQQRELSARRHEQEDGDGRLKLLAQRAFFAGHPYANRAVGTVETISAIKADDLAPHLAKLRDTNRLVLVVVGNVDPAHVLDQVKTAFASVPRGAYQDTPIPLLHFAAPHVAGDPFKLPTNYIESIFAAPSWRDPDFFPVWLGMRLLGQRVWDEVRTKRNLSYAPSAYLDRAFSAPFIQRSRSRVDAGGRADRGSQVDCERPNGHRRRPDEARFEDRGRAVERLGDLGGELAVRGARRVPPVAKDAAAVTAPATAIDDRGKRLARL